MNIKGVTGLGMSSCHFKGGAFILLYYHVRLIHTVQIKNEIQVQSSVTRI